MLKMPRIPVHFHRWNWQMDPSREEIRNEDKENVKKKVQEDGYNASHG